MSKAGLKYKGGFNKEIFESDAFQNYVRGKGPVFGYIGGGLRTPKRDEILANALYAQGLRAEGVATWLTSTEGRHLMYQVDDNMTLKAFAKLVKVYTRNAFNQVTAWSHPDHDGSIEATTRILRLMRTAKDGQ